MLSQGRDDADDFFEGCPLMALVATGSGRIERANAALLEALECSAEELATRSIPELFDEPERAEVAAAIEAVVEGGAERSFSARAARGDGAPRWLRIHAKRSPRGDAIHALVMDITHWKQRDDERRRTEMELARSQQLLRALLDNVPAVLFAVDPGGTFTLSDGLGLRALGLAPGQVVGLSAYEVYRDVPAIPAAIRRALSGDMSTDTIEVGQTAWQTRYIPLRGEDGVVREMLGLSLDVSERIRAERALQEQLDVIEAQRAAIRDLSLPIIEVWDGVLALPVVGEVGAARAAQATEALLDAVVQRGASRVIIDLTGAGGVDASTADHLLRLVQALTLVGARVIVSGIQPAAAASIASRGADLSRVETVRDLREAIRRCMRGPG